MRNLWLVLASSVSLLAACDGGRSGGAAEDGGNRDDAGTSHGADVFQVEFATTKGTFTIEADRALSPNGVDRFRELVGNGYYEGCRFFRVVPGFVVQWGMNGTPATNALWSGRAIHDDPVVGSNTRGTVSFAKTSAPNSRTTQLFINFGNNASLDAMGFSPIGRVVEGMDVVDAINAEYGQTPSQSRIAAEGNAYLDASFPRLDFINTTTVR